MTPETIQAVTTLVAATIGAGGALGGVAIVQHASGRRERDRAREARQDAIDERVRASAERVLTLVEREHQYVTQLRVNTNSNTEFDTAYEEHVYDELMMPLGHEIALIPNEAARSQLRLTGRALTSGLRVNRGSGELEFMVDVVLNAAAAVSAAYARGELPSTSDLQRLDRVVAYIQAEEKTADVSYLT